MSENELTTESRPKVRWALALVALVVLALVLASCFGRQRPVTSATVDGVPVALAEGTTVADLQHSSAFIAHPGRLISVMGSIIDTSGGEPVRVLMNGRAAHPEQRVFANDVLESRNGYDSVEATLTLLEPIPVQTRVTGSGPIMLPPSPGSVGIRSKVVGAESRATLSEQVLVPAQDVVVVRTRPRPRDKLIALTFDDGPWPGQTDKIVKILQREGVHATFFMVGARVKAAPKLAKQVAEAGNLIGNHSLGHRLLTKSKTKEIKRQITGGAGVIYRATGVYPTWFRPPYGAMNGRVWKQVRLAHQRVVLWNVDPRDWSRPGVKHIVRVTMKHARSGAIILMHDGGPNRKQTIKALPQIIRKLKKRGFTFVTIQELADAK